MAASIKASMPHAYRSLHRASLSRSSQIFVLRRQVSSSALRFRALSRMYERELEIARLAVQRASLVTKKIKPLLQQDDEVNKADDTPVTIADLTAQALVIGAIHHEFPHDTFLAEESAQILREDDGLADRVWSFASSSSKFCGSHINDRLWSPSSKEEMLDVIDLGKGSGGPKGRFWILDPIDGTMTYMKNQQYAVCLCLVEDGVKQVAVQGCPNLSLDRLPMHEDSVDLEKGGHVVSAVHNGGAYIQALSETPMEEPRRLPQKNDKSNITDLLNIVSHLSSSMDHKKVEAICNKIGIGYPGVDIWAQQMKYMAMAVGGHDVMIRIPGYQSHRTAAWDHASGQLICEEIGIVMTDVYGKKHDFSQGRRLYANFGDVAAPAAHHPQILKAVQEAMAS
ncbi:3'(2'),5'-bisphosphate nucleotidase [Verruconis gallopava]|uniref:3'(2'),5'-bisphosphate nucleotidase n=1 Tax=Verruconis gallopava TaxID=253628 RepID=A0A0D2AVQ1_9PEZI|nr:3'(2'),5'-bisphosphate nucleotidase [Verruconis gallopava]KIW03234.1 3'(2'),5'-bisphosphate nucleotidase [Verruconis gallopava]